jgi:hypothetical protein
MFDTISTFWLISNKRPFLGIGDAQPIFICCLVSSVLRTVRARRSNLVPTIEPKNRSLARAAPEAEDARQRMEIRHTSFSAEMVCYYKMLRIVEVVSNLERTFF